MRARELERLYKLEEIHHLLPALREVAASRRVIVLVDELDRGWDSSEDARAFVAGLFQACISVTAAGQPSADPQHRRTPPPRASSRPRGSSDGDTSTPPSHTRFTCPYSVRPS